MAQNVKTPIVYTNVLVRNWRPWVELKISDISAPMSFHNRVSLDFPVSLGGYRHPRDPGEPMCLHLVHVAGAPNQGLTARQQFNIGQAKLLAMPFSEFEARIRDELDRMLGPGRVFERDATLPPSRSTAGRTATAMWRIRCSTATIMARPSSARGKRPAA